jgi:hypothetical protein
LLSCPTRRCCSKPKAALGEYGDRARPIVRPGANPTWGGGSFPGLRRQAPLYVHPKLSASAIGAYPHDVWPNVLYALLQKSYAWTPYALAAFRALATKIKRVLLYFLARLGVNDNLAHRHPAIVTGVGVILVALKLGAGVGDSIAGEYTSVRHGTCLLWPCLRETSPSAEASYVVNSRIIPCAY